MEVQKLMLLKLDDLTQEYYTRFVCYLHMGMLDSCAPIPNARLEQITRENTVREMIQRYGDDKSLELMLAILREMGLNGEAETLKNEVAKNRDEKSQVSTPVASAVPSVSATNGSIVVAPVMSGCTMGAVNFNISK